MSKAGKNGIGKNVFHLFYSTALSRGINTVVLIVLVNYLNTENYGMFSVALAFAMVMGYFTDAGLSNTVLREGSKQNADVAAIVVSYIKLRAILLAATFLASYAIIHFSYDQPQLKGIMLSLVIPMVAGLALQSIGVTYFQLKEKMEYLGYIRICSSLVLVIFIPIGMLLSLHVLIIAFLFGLSYLIAGFYGLYLVGRQVKLDLQTPFKRSLLKNIWSFVLSGLLIMLLPQLGPLVLEKTITMTEVGIFAVAYRIPSALYQIPGVIAGAFYPVLFHHFHHGEQQEHLRLNILQAKIMGLIGMLMTIPVFFLSNEMVSLLFGAKWEAAAEPLKIAGLILFFQSISIAFADGLTTKNLQTRRTAVQFAIVVAALFLYYLLSGEFAVMGAVYAAVLIEIISVLGFLAMNPDRWAIAKRAAIYIVFFAVCFYGIDFLLPGNPYLASFASFVSICLLCMLDQELRKLILSLKKRRDVS
ncbi:oligosaccharide flippase family protein [Mesobacillus sp.]|uniref:oligosaccharide flippase family protein n=1 Tax=Mesobacillus sp. TaxID=2675271 RepID=UPI0039EEAB4A